MPVSFSSRYKPTAARSKSSGCPLSSNLWGPIHNCTASGLNETPARPAAATILPQFGSRPWIAVFTNDEPQTVRAIWRAWLLVSVPSTTTSITQVAPSPSRVIARARYSHNLLRPASKSGQYRSASWGPAAKANKQSFVLTSPSTVIALNDSSTTRCSIACHSAGGNPASQLTKASIVAISG